MRARVLGEKRRHTPRLRRSNGARVERAVRTPGIDSQRRGKPALDLCIDNVGPIALDADQGRARRLVEGVIRVFAAVASRFFHEGIARLRSLRWIDFCEADS